ncbi:MAG: hypothetical protein QXI58_00700 [Candidatus Micrarchaeia archaeon]
MIEIGIFNCHNGKIIKKELVEKELCEPKELFASRLLNKAKEISKWFDEKKTFFQKEIWYYWELSGFARLIEKFAKNEITKDEITTSVIVFEDDSLGKEYEFYLKRR